MRPEELTRPERRLWDAFPIGGQVDLRTGDPDDDDPAGGAGWGPERTVRAEVLAELLLGIREAEAGHAAAVSVIGARITGALRLNNAEFEHPLHLKACWFEAPVELFGTRARRLNLNDSHLPALLASHAWIDGNLRLSRCRTTTTSRLVATRISGALLMDGAHLADPGGMALTATRLQVDNDVLMRDGFTADGVIELRSARIGGGIQLSHARLRGHNGVAVDAARLRTEVDFSGYGMSATGKIGLRGANIAGTLFLRAATLDHPAGRTLDAPGAQIGADVVLDENFRSNGTIRLAHATIGGSLGLNESELTASSDGTALDAKGIQIGADAVLRDLTATGRLRLSGAQITGRVDTVDARMRKHSTNDISLSLRQTRAREVDLRYSVIGVLRDTAATWPARIRLDGAAYEQLENPLHAADRLSWLARDQGAYLPQPYEQLAATYRRLGHEDEARLVLLTKQRARRAQLPWYRRPWGFVQDATVGYGYRPALAVGWLLGLLAVGTLVFRTNRPRPLEPEKAIEFEPVVFALDTLLPVIDFGQGSAFAPVGGSRWLAYLLTAAGLLLASAVATGIARAISRP